MGEVSFLHRVQDFPLEVVQHSIANEDVLPEFRSVARELPTRKSPVEKRRQRNSVHRRIALRVTAHRAKLARRELLPAEKRRVMPLTVLQSKLETILVGVPAADARIIHPFLRLLRQLPLGMVV